ncbi:hypothetical protein B0H13DRAFT_2307043 [Mycena leptocephala]|nr:hypothetical protein B0H13DRAFT_2307043 [Mycena leptocephala]
MPLLRGLDLELEHPSAVFVASRDVPLLRKVFRQFALPQSYTMGSIDFSGFRWSILRRMCPDLQQASNLMHCELMVDGRHRNQPEPDIRLLCLESLTLDNFGNAFYYHSFLVILFTQGDDSTPATVIYSPHSVRGADLAGLTSVGSGKGFRNPHARAAPRLARPTHDEVKRGGGFIALLLRRTRYTVADAVAHETRTQGEKAPGDYEFVELGSGHGLALL